MAKKKPQTQEEIDNAALTSLWGKAGTEAGNAMINKLGANGQFLGRVGEQTPGQNEYVDKLKGTLEGYTSPEYQAQREQMQQGVNSQYATASNQLAKAQARGKVYGAAGAAQQANLIQGTADNKNNLEQQLMVQNINEKQNRLNQYGQANMANQNSILERQKLNMGNNASEIATRSEAMTGAGGLALTKEQNAIMANIQKMGLAAINGGGHPSTPKVKTNKPKGK